MYSSRPNLMLGFHGCEAAVRDRLVTMPKNVKKSEELYDWLGHGFYVWENNLHRAQQWADDKRKRGIIKDPAVLGVVFQLGNCLDFTDAQYIDVMEHYFGLMKSDFEYLGKDLPVNKDLRQDKHKDKVLRELDCAVIEYMHQKIQEQIDVDVMNDGYSELKQFDSVRGIFTEGGPAFDGAGIQKKNHIQICIRNINCIKGFFVPREKVRFP